MKYLLLLILLPVFLFAQDGWDNSKWKAMEFYDNGQRVEAQDRYILDIKCFEDGTCYATGTYKSLYIEVYKLDSEKERWNRVYDGYWGDPFEIPEKDWPDLVYNPLFINLLSDSTVFIYYGNTTIISIFNFRTGEYDSTNIKPAYAFMNAELNKNGYGMASIANFIYTTKNYWKDYIHKDIEFHSSAFKVPIKVIEDTVFALADYDDGKCYFTTSENGEVWKRFYVGNFYPLGIYFMNSEIGFISGGVLDDNHTTESNDIYKTTDGGKSWYKVLSHFYKPKSFGIVNILMLKDKYGVATTEANIIYTSNDGGESWKLGEVDTILPGYLHTHLYKGKEECYIVGPSEDVYSYDLKLLGITSVPIYKYKPLSVYPNPVRNELNIGSGNLIKGFYELKLFSSTSKLIMSKKVYIDNGFKFDLDVPTGTYYLLLEGDNYYYSKIVKE